MLMRARLKGKTVDKLEPAAAADLAHIRRIYSSRQIIFDQGIWLMRKEDDYIIIHWEEN